MEKFIEKLKEKNVFLQSDIQKTRDRTTFYLYTEPDREIYRFTIRTNFNFMDVGIYHQNDFDDTRTSIFTNARDEIKEFILQCFHESECDVLLMDRITKTNLFHDASDFSCYKEEFGENMSVVKNENTFYLEKYSGAFRKYCLFSTYLTRLKESFSLKYPLYKFSIDFRNIYRKICFDGYFKGVKFTLYIKIKENEILFFQSSFEPKLFCRFEYNVLDYDNLERIFSQTLENLYKKNRLRLLSNPPKFYFEQLMRRLKNAISLSLHDLFYQEFSKTRNPEEIEQLCYDLLQEKGEILYTLRSRLNKTFFGCYFIHDYYFVVLKNDVSIEKHDVFSFDTKEEAFKKYSSLHENYMNKVITPSLLS